MPDHPQAVDKINAYYQNEILAQDDQDDRGVYSKLSVRYRIV